MYHFGKCRLDFRGEGRGVVEGSVIELAVCCSGFCPKEAGPRQGHRALLQVV